MWPWGRGGEFLPITKMTRASESAVGATWDAVGLLAIFSFFCFPSYFRC